MSEFNVVEELTEHPGFTGDKINIVFNPALGGLHLDAAMSFLDLPDTLVIDNWMIGPEGLIESGVYSFSAVLDLGEVYTSQITSNIDVTGIDVRENMLSWLDVLSVTNWLGVGSGDYAVVLEVRTTDDDTGAAPVWSDWKPLTIGDLTFRGLDLRLNLVSLADGITPLVVGLSVTVDMPDRLVSGDDLVCPVAGTRIVYDPPFLNTPALAITGQGMVTGDVMEIGNKDRTGADLIFKTSGGAAVERTFDFIAKGYGRETVL